MAFRVGVGRIPFALCFAVPRSQIIYRFLRVLCCAVGCCFMRVVPRIVPKVVPGEKGIDRCDVWAYTDGVPMDSLPDVVGGLVQAVQNSRRVRTVIGAL